MEADDISSLIFFDSIEQSSVFGADDKSPQKLYSTESITVTPLSEEVPQPVCKVVQVENLLQAVKRIVNTALAEKTCSAEDFALLQDNTFLETHFSSSTKGYQISQVAKIVVREKLWGITPPLEGLELTITRNMNIDEDDTYYLIIKNLCTGVIINIPMEDFIFFDFSIYRGYLFLHSVEEGLFVLNLDDSIARTGAGGHSIETVALPVSYDGRFFLDNTSTPPTMLRLKNCQEETFKITRYGDFSCRCQEGQDENEDEDMEEDFIFDVIFSKTFTGNYNFEWPTETGVPGLAADKEGMIWVQINHTTRSREHRTFFCIISPDFADSSVLQHRAGLELYPWGQGKILLKREIKENRRSETRKSEYYLLSYRR